MAIPAAGTADFISKTRYRGPLGGSPIHAQPESVDVRLGVNISGRSGKLYLTLSTCSKLSHLS